MVGTAVELEGVTINVLVLKKKNCQVQLPQSKEKALQLQEKQDY
jgi:hypothetical protein